MTRKSAVLGFATAAVLIACTSRSASAQANSSSSSAPVPHIDPIPPPTPPKNLTPASALPPTDSSIALCKNGTWIYVPGTIADCAQRGGLQVALPPRARVPQVAIAAAAQAIVIAPAKVASAPPATATMQCKDGTFVYGTPSDDRCSANGGVAALFPHPTPPPARPTRP